MRRQMLVERIYRKPEGGMVLVQRFEEVDFVEPGCVPDSELVHCGEMPQAVKDALFNPTPLFLR